jgi:hypothetical protein
MKRWNKSGQFYLIAALAIIPILIGIATVTNKSEAEQSSRVIYDWKDQLDIESSYVLDYATANDVDRNELLENFTELFSGYSPETEFYFIFGEGENLNAYRYLNGSRESVDYQIDEQKIKIDVGETNYEFPLLQGENFYYIIYNMEGYNKYVAAD